jgi:hypothetical protein
VLVRDIECNSMCEHHVLPFFGRVHVAYLPQGRVVGISKLARIVDCFSKRLQIQERLTEQVAHAVAEACGARGVIERRRLLGRTRAHLGDCRFDLRSCFEQILARVLSRRALGFTLALTHLGFPIGHGGHARPLASQSAHSGGS